MSNRAGYLCTVGRNSLAVYLLHGFVVRLLDIPLDDSLDHISSPVMLVACVLLAVLTTWLFALPPFNAGLRKYGEGVVRMIFLPFSKLRSVRAPS